MTEIEFKVETEEFEEWLFGLHHQFIKMVQTMKDVFEVFKATMNSMSLVPLDTGRLERSFHYQIYENSNFIEMYSIFSAVDPDSGYDYAEYQHEHILNHPKRGTDHYLFKGINASESLMWTIIEQDYMELFNGGNL